MNDLTRFILVCVIFLQLITKGSTQDFGYDGTEGPNFWGQKYHACVGKHQSPINIEEHNVKLVSLPPMTYKNFDEEVYFSVENNGHTVLFKPKAEEIPTITGGPLFGDYQFAQLHFHWGDTDDEGSENRINNSSYPMELHMVFYNADYGSVQNATEHPDGLTVLSFLFTRDEEINEKYTSIIETLPNVITVGSTTETNNPVTLENLIAADRSTYYTYGGSLTTPPCSEVVTWIEYNNTVPLAHQQMEAFRELNSLHGKLMHNYRPIQPLHGRVIRMNKDIYMQRNSSSTTAFNMLFLLVNAIIVLLNKKI